MQCMIIVINAGGSGTRLWPLSTPEYPKHLLKLIGDESLLQNAYRRAKKVTQDVYVVTEKSHSHHVQEQLPDMDNDHIIVEPGRRGTANCLIAGLVHVEKRHGRDVAIAFIHADHVIRDVGGFVYSFNVAGKSAVDHKRLTLVGLEPTYPSTVFGYIQKSEAIDDGLLYTVAGFKEKPAQDVAKEYVESGKYLWNCGYFVATAEVFERDLKLYAPKFHQNYVNYSEAKTDEARKEVYLSFESEAIDYALMEHDDNLQVVPASFDWMDVGSFKDMHDAIGGDANGNHMRGLIGIEEVSNSMIRNEDPSSPVAVIGLDNVVVINTKHGVLVARKDLAQKIKEVAQNFEHNK